MSSYKCNFKRTKLYLAIYKSVLFIYYKEESLTRPLFGRWFYLFLNIVSIPFICRVNKEMRQFVTTAWWPWTCVRVVRLVYWLQFVVVLQHSISPPRATLSSSRDYCNYVSLFFLKRWRDKAIIPCHVELQIYV